MTPKQWPEIAIVTPS